MGILAPRAGTGPADLYGDGPAIPPVAAPAKIGTWDKGGTGRYIVGYIADALAQMGGVKPVFAAALEQQREMEKGILARQLEEQQWQRREEFKQANRAPFRFEANNGDQMEVGPDGQPRLLFKDPTQRMVRNYDGTWSVQPTAPTAPQTAPPGVTFKPLGGAPQSGARTFPIR